MSEEPPENYNSGDIVWVKLGSCWWPGEVKDVEELPNEVNFKKPPLAIVKFFDEDSYEYVRSWGNIFPYNSEKKNEFIKKGMAAYRAKASHMEKFPKDVITAETKLGGNPNILSEPMFLPEIKRTYVAEVFGTPSPKNKGHKDKKRASTSKSGSKDTAHITHRRFLGVDDYQAIICIQYPGKDRTPGDREDEEVIRINREQEQDFNCHTCSFTTKRLEVMILHTKSHIQGIYVPSSRKIKHPGARRKKEKSKRFKGSDDVMDSDSSSNDSDYVREKKRKTKPQTPRKSKKKEEKPKEPAVKTSSDIRSELLAVWDDSDEDEDFDLSVNKSTASESNLSQCIKDIIFGKTDEKDVTVESSVGNDTLNESEQKTEETEKLDKSLEETLNQTEDESVDQSKGEPKLEDQSTLESKQSSQKVVEEPSVETTQESKDEDETLEGEKGKDDLADEAAKPKSKMDKDIQEAIKSCFDFEEDEEEDSALLSKAAAGRKIPRVIPPAERRKSEDVDREGILKESEKFNQKAGTESQGDDVDATFKELMEMTSVPELPDVQNTLKCEQNFHDSKTIKFPDKSETVGSPPIKKSEIKEATDAATKLINPKKRFVKSFEDFELMQNEIRRKEEEQMESKKEPGAIPGIVASCYDNEITYDEPTVKLSMLKSKIMSKIIEEAKIDNESKHKIMSKMQESNIDNVDAKVGSSNEEVKTGKAGSSHRTPRSKILESYRNDTNKLKMEQEKKLEETDTTNKQDASYGDMLVRNEVVPPKKAKWSRRGSHPKKDKSSFLLGDIKDDGVAPKPLENEKLSEELAKVDNQISVEVPASSITGESHSIDILSDDLHKEDVITREDNHTVLSSKQEASLVEKPINKEEDGLTLDVEIATDKSKIDESEKEVGEVSVDKEEHEESFTEMPVTAEIEVTSKDQTDLRDGKNLKDKVSSHLEEEIDIEDYVKVPKDDKYNEEVLTEDVETQLKDEIDIEDDVKVPNNDKENEEVSIEDAESLLTFSPKTSPLKRPTLDILPENIPLPDENIPFSIEDIPLPSENVSFAAEKRHLPFGIPLPTEKVHLPTEDVYMPIEKIPLPSEAVPLPTSEIPISTEDAYLPTEKIALSTEKECSLPVEHIPLSTGKIYMPTEDCSSLPTEGTMLSPEEIPLPSESVPFPTEEIPLPSETVPLPTEKIPLPSEDMYIPVEKIPLPAEDIPLPSQNILPEDIPLPPENVFVPLEDIPLPSEIPPVKINESPMAEVPPVKIMESENLSAEITDTPTEDLSTQIIDSPSEDLPVEMNESPSDVLSVEISDSVPEVVVEETAQMEPEEVQVVSPSRDVFAPIDNITLKDAICSPPKKNKKRKMSESSVTILDAERSKAELEPENFSPAEKKNKSIDIAEIDKEPQDVVVDMPTEPQDTVRDPNSEINSTGLVKDANTPKPTSNETGMTEEHCNELEIQCGTSSPESFKFSIQTNLSNLTSREEISALALATLSEIKDDLEGSSSSISEEKPYKTVPPVRTEPEMVPIEGNLTVVSERDLADGQVEITTEQVISPKKPVMLSNFSMDFLDSASDSNSNSTLDTLSDFASRPDFNAKGTEFTSKAMTKQIRKIEQKKQHTYERLELLNILEGNSDVEKKSQLPKRNVPDDICDFEEHIPSQIVSTKKLKKDGTLVESEFPYVEKIKGNEKSKLLERLTVTTNKSETKTPLGKPIKGQTIMIRGNKYMGKVKMPVSSNKAVILSEQILKPAETPKPKVKKALDIEDVEPFVIQKDQKKAQIDSDIKETVPLTKSTGKAKILQQTIITPAGEIIQPTVNPIQVDDNIFDINSMPIVLSDEILTPESIENMPIMISGDTKMLEQEKPVKKLPSKIIGKTITVTQPVTSKTQVVAKQPKSPRILQTVGGKVLKNSPLLPNIAKPGKYLILPQGGTQTAKYITKKGPVVKRTEVIPKTQNIAPEPSGNKIMIVTNQQGQQQRLLLTPAQQKMLGYQTQKTTRTVVKGNIIQKSVLATKSSTIIEPGTSGIISKGSSLVGQKVILSSSSGATLMETTSPQTTRIVKSITKKVHPMSQKMLSGVTTGKTQKTILIKNQHGHTVRKIQGTDDELLDKQVAEQLEAIKASSAMKFSSQLKQPEAYKTPPKTQPRRSYAKKAEPKTKLPPPPLTGIKPSPKIGLSTTVVTPKKTEPVEVKPPPPAVVQQQEVKPAQDRPLNQLVIQDAVGNQTTITEGQILALPSETVDGQPQSYMLVTLDESGNLTPLNNEALMSLDPNLGLGGDLSNMVLQIDQSALADQRPQSLVVKASLGSEPPKLVEIEPPPPAPVPVPEPAVTTEVAETVVQPKSVAETSQTLAVSTNGEPGQQLIVTGDPIATQKFLESLTEGTTDLANILANAEGNSILIQADGQQILINTNSDNQMLLSVNNDSLNASESTEGGGNPIFATQPSKNQDILAAALADTDVFQQEQHAAHSKITSQLSPSNALYPMNVGNVLETSLTLNSPIMTPLEVPSTNSKKIPDDEADILTQVPKNVDLPITITDPNIAQTVANQQVASLMVNELHTNLELTLPVSETTISSVSSEMNSPYVYSLATLDESVDLNQKPFNSSMPLLNEDIEEASSKSKSKMERGKLKNGKGQAELSTESSFLEEEEGRFTLGGEMCSSLSEPPPEMFDLPELDKRSGIPSSLQSTPDVSDNASKDDDATDLSVHTESSNDGSCEIPLQPQIVTKSLDLSEKLSSLKRSLESDEEENKRCKFD